MLALPVPDGSVQLISFNSVDVPVMALPLRQGIKQFCATSRALIERFERAQCDFLPLAIDTNSARHKEETQTGDS